MNPNTRSNSLPHVLSCEGPPCSKDFRERTLKTLKMSLGKLWRRRSVTITEYDPTYKVAYLGNVLTGWAKGEGCVEKPLTTLWRNYTGNSKPDVQMKVTVTQSGLKAVTKEHGLTEYWSHRITYCGAPAGFPRVFCWVYRHEGRKLKQELRCHAVLCPKESTARDMACQLKARLAQALNEFKRDKVCRQNARLSLANSVYDNPSMPRRKILLSTGSHNYRPPLERSKSAPKLMVIEESVEEECEDELQDCELKDDVFSGSDKSSSMVQDIISIFNDHQRNMRDEHSLALGNRETGVSPRTRRKSESDTCPPKRVAWNLENSTQRLLVINNEISEEEELVVIDSDEGSNSLQSISSSESGHSSDTAISVITHSSEEDIDDEQVSVDLRPSGDSPHRLLLRSATFPPASTRTVSETTELDSLSEEEEEETTRKVDDEDDVSDESGYAELVEGKESTEVKKNFSSCQISDSVFRPNDITSSYVEV